MLVDCGALVDEVNLVLQDDDVLGEGNGGEVEEEGRSGFSGGERWIEI